MKISTFKSTKNILFPQKLANRITLMCLIALSFSLKLTAQSHVNIAMVFVSSTATTADFDVILTNDGTTLLNFNAIVMRANNASIASIATAGSTVTAIALNNNSIPAWTIGGVVWPGIITNMSYNQNGATFKLNQSSNSQFFLTLAERPSLPIGVPVNIGRFRFVVTGGTWIPNSQLGFAWHPAAGIVCSVNNAPTALTNLNTAATVTLVNSVNQPLNPLTTGIMSGNGTICSVGDSANISVAVTGGVGPYQLVYTDGTTNDTIPSYVSGAPISVSPTVASTYTIVSIDGSAVGHTGSAIISIGATAPVPNTTSLATVTAQCTVASINAPTATSSCFGTITGTSNVTFPISTQGTTTVTWTYDDGAGNTLTQTQQVIITDNTAPVADVSSLTPVTSQCSVASIAPPTATDNCSGLTTGTTTTSFPITAQGTTTVTWTYTDGLGNTSTQTQQVIITDNIAPVADAASLTPVTSQCSLASLTPPTATDNCVGTVTGTTNVTFPITAPGTTNVVWTYSDGHGNTSSQTQQVIITDNIAPVGNATALSTITAQCSVASIVTPTATDNCLGTVTGTPNVTFPITAQGTTTVTWTYTDGHGNTSTQTQLVIITDNIAPVANVGTLPTITAQCSVASIAGPTATDNCVGTVTGTASVTFPITAQGTTLVTWTYSDGHGNTTTQTQQVIITDNTAPVANIASLATVSAQCSVASIIPPTATDNCSGIVTGTTTTSFPITVQGTTNVIWTYTDGQGNTSTQTQQVVITDNIAPVATIATLATITDQCSVASIVPPTATDNCSGLVTGTTTTSFPITAQGTTTVTWTYTDGLGNTSTQTQQVVVTDNISPVANIASLASVTNQCSVASIVAPTATDNCSGQVTGTTTTSFPITAQGTTTVTWTYTDGQGNTTTQTQQVVITDNTAPVPDLTALPSLTGNCSLTLTPPTATDACSGIITGTSNAVSPITTPGLTVVIWTYDDGNGNIVTQNQNVTISTPNAAVTQNGGTLTANSATGSYQWLDCDNNYSMISGATNQSFTPSALVGNYALLLTEFGCTDTSICYNVNITGIEENVAGIEIQIYPNPNHGQFTIHLIGSTSESIEMQILDITGRRIEISHFETLSGNNHQNMDLSKHENGIYIINLVGENGVISTNRIIKN